MRRTQVSPASLGLAGLTSTSEKGYRALNILSRWASRRARDNSRNLNKGATANALIEMTRSRQLVAREKVFKKHIPFSWPRFIVGLVSLALVFSDIPRSGIGVSSVQGVYPSLQPDEMMVFGSSWNYSVFSATRTEAASGHVKARVWSYKFDTTSIVWRAFASYSAVPEFPECFFCRMACPDEYFGSDVAFDMIDSLVNAVQNMKYTSNKWTRSHSGPIALTLRTQNEYIDRLHQFLFPTLFPNINWRLNQALYYSSKVLKNINAHTICFPAAGRTRVQTPRLCQDLWTNFDRSCAANDIQGRKVGLLYVHTMKRLRGIQARFPDLSVDLTFLESQEDMQVCRGGLSSSGVRRSDISTIIRARKCAHHLNASISCETMFVDDYRYETGILTSDVVHWYRLLKMLRLLGQSYFFIRGIGLVLSCYFVYGSTQPKDNLFTWTRLRSAYYLFIKVPTQCVVYGSSFPVACYVFAHLLDAPFTYQVLESRFYTQSGILYLPFGLFISYVVVQMRNVWIYTLAWHLAMSMISSRWWTRNNPLHNGIVGLPPFFLSTMSGITLFAQYRSTAFRSAKVLHIMEFPSNIGRGWEAVKYQFGFAHRGRGNIWLGAVVIDLKFLICFVIATAAAWGLRNLLLQIRNDKRHRHWFVLTPTPVPYSAGVLWPVTSTCVHWRVSLFCFGNERVHVHRRGNIPKRQPRKSTLGRWSTMMDGRISPFPLNSTEIRQLQVHNRKYNNTPLASTRVGKRRFIQHQMMCLHHRSDEVEATIAFMNVVLLSDPLVFLKIVLGSDESTQLGYYQSVWRPQQIVLLPMVVVGENNEYTSGLKLLRRVNASELSWSELVQPLSKDGSRGGAYFNELGAAPQAAHERTRVAPVSALGLPHRRPFRRTCVCFESPGVVKVAGRRRRRGVKTTLSNLLKTNRQYFQWEFSEALVQTIRRADLSMVRWLLRHFSKCPVSEKVVREAAKGGHFWVLQLLEADKRHSGIQWREKGVAHCLTVAAKAGHWELMKWLHERASTEETRSNNFELLEIAVTQNSVERVKWVVSNGFAQATIGFEDCPQEKWGTRVEVLRYLLKEGVGDSAFIVAESLTQAVKFGDLETTQWLVARNEEFYDDDVFDTILYEACKQGDLRMVQWLLEHVDYLGQANGPPDAMHTAATYGKLNIVRWLWEHYSRDPTVSLFQKRDPTAMDAAAENGHMDALQFLDTIEAESHVQSEERRVKRPCQRDRYPYCTPTAMDAAAANGHLDVVKWLHAFRSEGCTTAAMDGAAGNGHLKVVQWLHWNRSEGATSAAIDNAAMRRYHAPSCRNPRTEKCCLDKAPKSFYEDQLEVLRWLHSNRSEFCTTAAMDGAAANGNFKVLRWLHKSSRATGTTNAMDAAAGIGRLDIVKWLLAKPRLRCTKAAMENAAAGGHLQVVKWLHSHCNEGCTEKAMNLAAANGHLHVVRWLLANRSESCIVSAMEHAIVCHKFEVMWYLDSQRTNHSPSLRSFRTRLRNTNLWQLTH